jgi:hypothetical protein
MKNGKTTNYKQVSYNDFQMRLPHWFYSYVVCGDVENTANTLCVYFVRFSFDK